MSHCSECRSDNLAGAKFCSSCGAPLRVQCAACGQFNRPGSKFCNECGGALSAKEIKSGLQERGTQTDPKESTLALEGERKLVTALFVDIINSTGLEQDLDPEDARAIIDPVLRLMIDAVRRYDGYVVQSTGDGIFALFGAPVAHEDHPQRSLYTALRLNEEIRRLSDRLRSEGRPPIQIRAGANTGEVVVRQIQTGDQTIEYTPIGHTVNLASRIQALANAGSIVISDSTRKLVEGFFALRSMGPTRLKGINDPIVVHEVIGLGPLRTRLEKSAGRGLSKFVGRSRESAAFQEAAERTRSGEGQIVAVVAEPGVGKSRLFHEFKAEASALWTVMEAFSVAHAKSWAFLPVIEMLQAYFGIASEDAPSLRRDRVAARLEQLDPVLATTLPFIGSLLEFGSDDERLAGMNPQLRRARILEAVVDLLVSEANNHRLILIVEDLQWLDDESQAVLDLLVERLPTAPLLLLVNFRPEYALRWGTRPNCRQLRLDALDESNAEEMLTAMLGSSPDLLPLKQVIIETTGGTPFFMEETVQTLFDEGALARDNGRTRLVKPLASLRIPPTVQAILAARIDRLHNDEKNLLQTLAVLGREFVLSLARAVAGKSQDELERLILNLQLGEFVFEQPSISDVEYTFKHALTQEVAYNSVLLERRKRLHESVGEAMESIYSGSLDDHLVDLARHFSRSGNRAKAVEYLRRAGTQAVSRGALAQAVQDLETALDLLNTLPGGPQRDVLELQVLNPLGMVYIAVRGYAAPEVGPVFQRARELCDEIGEPQQQFLVVFGNFAWRIVRGEMDLALALAQEGITLAKQIDDPGVWMEALFLMGVVLFYRGDFAGARQQYEKALPNYDDRERTRSWAFQVGEDAGVTHRCYLAPTLWHLGYPDQALKLSQETSELARVIGHPFSLSYAQHHASWLRQLMRLPDETLAFGQEQARYAGEQGFPLFHATGLSYAAAGRLLKGDTERGLPEFVAGLESYRATGAGLALPHYFGLLGEALGQAGRGFDGAELLNHALDLAERSNEWCHKAELQRQRGEMALGQGLGFKVAETHMLRAIETARAQGSKAWELRATISLARLYEGQARQGEARAALTEVLGSYTEGFDTPDLQQAKALLGAL